MEEESKAINAIINSNSNSNSNTSKNKSNSISIELQQHQVNPMFHDFLGMKPSSDSPLGFPSKANDVVRVAEASPSASASVGASSGGGGRGPISSTSDLGSVEKQAGNHLEGVPFYGPRSDISGSEISNRLLRSKRTNSDSVFMGQESLESLHLMKILRNGAGGERSRRSNDGETLPVVQHLRPSSAALILQPPAGSRSDVNVSKWERSIPMSMNAGPAVQYPPRGGQIMPYMHQIPSNRFKDINASTSVISQTAADEGSRTGIKGPGLLSSMNTGGGVSEKNSYGVLPCRSRPKSGAHIMEPESSTPPNHQGLASASRQMTIFYGGQAHVFDDVHPNKADVIMSLAGSNGGSWSTIYSPKPNVKPVNESYAAGRESEGTETINAAFPRGRLSASGNSSQGAGTCDRTMTPTGIPHGIVTIAKEGRNVVQAAHPGNDDKREV